MLYVYVSSSFSLSKKVIVGAKMEDRFTDGGGRNLKSETPSISFSRFLDNVGQSWPIRHES